MTRSTRITHFRKNPPREKRRGERRGVGEQNRTGDLRRAVHLNRSGRRIHFTRVLCQTAIGTLCGDFRTHLRTRAMAGQTSEGFVVISTHAGDVKELVARCQLPSQGSPTKSIGDVKIVCFFDARFYRLGEGDYFMFRPKICFFAFIVLTALIYAPLPTQAQVPNPYQSRNKHFGVSGSNRRDFTSAFCCSGTLGSLVTAGGILYILSANHILALQDNAVPGQNISQPGLIDNGCQPATIVANFTTAPQLGTNVDAAIAQLRGSRMNTSGYIEGIGTISSVLRIRLWG